MKFAAFAIALLIACSSALARDYSVRGPGTQSCGTWLNDKGQRARFDHESWVMGYLSGYNAYGLTVDEDVAQGTDAKGLFAWIDNYCSEHTLDTIANAADALVQELRRRGNFR